MSGLNFNGQRFTLSNYELKIISGNMLEGAFSCRLRGSPMRDVREILRWMKAAVVPLRIKKSWAPFPLLPMITKKADQIICEVVCDDGVLQLDHEGFIDEPEPLRVDF